ncbi:DNA-directed RNA polymerase II subunit 1, partial [Tanacetum coccineum]
QLPEPAERKQQLSAERVLSVLKRISDEDCLLLGLNPKYARPDWMILQVLPIPPPPVRPSVMMDTPARSEARAAAGAVVPGDDLLSIEAHKNATLFFSILLRSTFASKRVLS